MNNASSNSQEAVTEDTIRAILATVLDPEVGENIVDLGLIYGVKIIENLVNVDLTMTSAACPMGEILLDNIHETLTRNLPASFEIEMHLVWEPPWEPDMMSAAAKERLGWS